MLKLKKLFIKEKTIKRVKKYDVIVRWYHDTPWYLNCTMRDIKKFEMNPEVVCVDVLG